MVSVFQGTLFTRNFRAICKIKRFYFEKEDANPRKNKKTSTAVEEEKESVSRNQTMDQKEKGPSTPEMPMELVEREKFLIYQIPELKIKYVMKPLEEEELKLVGGDGENLSPKEFFEGVVEAAENMMEIFQEMIMAMITPVLYRDSHSINDSRSARNTNIFSDESSSPSPQNRIHSGMSNQLRSQPLSRKSSSSASEPSTLKFYVRQMLLRIFFKHKVIWGIAKRAFDIKFLKEETQMLRNFVFYKEIKMEELGILPRFQLKNEEVPYREAIEKAKEIQVTRNIIKKFTMVCELKDLIRTSIINGATGDIDPSIEIEKLLDPDQLVSIYTYIILASRNSKIVSDLEMIEAFICQSVTTMNTDAYYYSTMMVALRFLVTDEQVNEKTIKQFIYKELKQRLGTNEGIIGVIDNFTIKKILSAKKETKSLFPLDRESIKNSLTGRQEPQRHKSERKKEKKVSLDPPSNIKEFSRKENHFSRLIFGGSLIINQQYF